MPAHADYKWSLHGLAAEQLEAATRACHLRSAARPVNVCTANGGVYIKAGQHLGQMVGHLPDAAGRAAGNAPLQAASPAGGQQPSGPSCCP